MPVQRSDGITKTERYLQSLCDHTFLSLWSYPGVYRNQKTSKGKDGKEVCDLLVVFDDNIIIFSDKDCEFPNTGNLELDWNRWFKKAVQKSADQLWGAERWIKKYPERLFLDRACTQPFPIEIADITIAKFHLVVVAHDHTMRCRRELGGSGSLMINSAVQGFEQHCAGKQNGGIPFLVGELNPECTFVHILNDIALDIVLKTLDTISDFVNYLSKKEDLLRSNKPVVLAAGEEELLADYLKHWNDRREHDFFISGNEHEDIPCLVFQEGLWNKFIQHPKRKAQLLADEVSYIWDNLIETFNRHIMEETQYHTTSHYDVKSIEIVVRFLARETRFRRRLLAELLYEFIESAPQNTWTQRYICAKTPEEPYYVFLTVPKYDWMNYEDYRKARGYLLEISCSSVKLKFPNANHIIGIATEPGFGNGEGSEDALYFKATHWTSEDESNARNLAEQLGIPQSPPLNMSRMNDKEYPA